MSQVNSTKVSSLQDRALLLKRARDFFAARNVTEVDCPILSPRASVDAHIDLIQADYKGSERCYLHSSPEYGMKRLLSIGLGDIYQLSHVFRDGEFGVKHNPEFMMAEWYRVGFTLEKLIDETVQFVRLFLGELPYNIVSYRDAFIKYAGIDYHTASEDDLFHYLLKNNIPIYPGIKEEGKDALLNLILGNKIEPQLGQNELCILAYYPSTQAALAKKRWVGDEEIAERFEVYYKGVELANGYHELTDSVEQRKRFIEANEMRKSLGKNTLPIDELFLEALKNGIPDCCGVAVGFDRLMMLRRNAKNIGEVIAWSWEVA